MPIQSDWVFRRGAGEGSERMKVVHLYTGDDDRSHFADLDVPMSTAALGGQSATVPAEGVIFRETPQGGEQDFHPAPRRQFVVTLSGQAEIELGDGTKRRFNAGDVMLADDTSGQGHITRVTQGPRHYLFVTVPDSVDVSKWRA
jgi:hypothetical protein